MIDRFGSLVTTYTVVAWSLALLFAAGILVGWIARGGC